MSNAALADMVRVATPKDEEAVMEMCRHLHAENGLFSLDELKVRDCLHRCFNREGTIVGVIERGGVYEGSTCLAISDYYYTRDWHLAEFWTYVEPEYRRSHNAEALIEFNIACSDRMKIPFITGIITNQQMAGKVRLYRRLLGYPSGAFFVHGAQWKSEPMQDHSTLRQRLREFAQRCNDRQVTAGVAQKQLAPLLREAADAIGGEDNIWGAGTQKRNAPREVTERPD